jgi:hypothetical protein
LISSAAHEQRHQSTVDWPLILSQSSSLIVSDYRRLIREIFNLWFSPLVGCFIL